MLHYGVEGAVSFQKACTFSDVNFNASATIHKHCLIICGREKHDHLAKTKYVVPLNIFTMVSFFCEGNCSCYWWK